MFIKTHPIQDTERDAEPFEAVALVRHGFTDRVLLGEE